MFHAERPTLAGAAADLRQAWEDAVVLPALRATTAVCRVALRALYVVRPDMALQRLNKPQGTKKQRRKARAALHAAERAAASIAKEPPPEAPQ